MAILEIANVSKKFILGTTRNHEDNLREVLVRGLRSSWQTLRGKRIEGKEHANSKSIWALRDVSFDVERGDVVGIIGLNGAGKSTLLKILSRITDPTEGFVKVRGRIASLLEIGTGFHPELTGRENIYFNGVMLGMAKAEIQKKFDEIVAFAELETFLDTPVKRYSSGMYVRLGFAVAAHLDPEILIVDEVLAVGDHFFQKKCLGKMSEFGREGRTVLFVSHNMAAVENLCQKGVVLRQGRVAFHGTSKAAINYYIESMTAVHSTPSHIIDLAKAASRSSQWRSWLQQLEIYSGDFKPFCGILPIGAALMLRIRFCLEKPTSKFDISVYFRNLFGQDLFVARSSYEPNRTREERTGEQEFTCEIPSLPFLPGQYRMAIGLSVANRLVDYIEDAARLTVMESDYYGTGKIPTIGLCVLEQHWQLA
jgi:lipopolysaccharide transport system ATP-binding protein